MRVIDKIINDLEERSIELEIVGEDEKAEQTKLLASKYKEMKYNGHLTVYDKEDTDE